MKVEKEMSVSSCLPGLPGEGKEKARGHDPLPRKKPPWLKVGLPSHQNFFSVSGILGRHGLNTICRSARCPNISECWSQKTATFLILGNTCTRSCSFCAVTKGTPSPPASDEPFQVAEAAASLGLRHVVITSVTRDDLPDGGASHFARTISALRARILGVRIEALVPDFSGREEALIDVLEAAPDILNHNLETTESLYPRINRPLQGYRRSLGVLKTAKDRGAVTKSGLMAGLGEDKEEILKTMTDLREADCDLLTIGQYLRPTRSNVPVKKYYTPEEFNELKESALAKGFKGVESGPLVRSSFHAGRLYDSWLKKG